MLKKILLTGSSSYLGTKFIELYGNQYDICGLSRSNAANPIDLLNFEKVKEAYQDFKPDLIIHAAADIGRDGSTADAITRTNPAITKNLVKLAQSANTPFIFTSTEAVYGGKELEGEYKETDERRPRSPYGESKVASEDIVLASGLPYLIIRGHRFVGINKNYSRKKQFPDTLRALIEGQEVHLDSVKLFKPTLINNICDVFNHYFTNESEKQVLLNLGTDKATKWHDFMVDVADLLGLDKSLIKPDGNEAGWPQNSTLSLVKLLASGYPIYTYKELLNTLKADS